MSPSIYLEQYLEGLQTLPDDVRNNFTIMRDLDERTKKIMREIDEVSEEYLRRVRDLSPTKRKGEMEKIQKMFKKAKEYGDDKVQLAIKTYELVDKHIRKLDSDLPKFEAEMKEKGRLSQTEESEPEEANDAKRGHKKKGRPSEKKKKGRRDDDKSKRKKQKNDKADLGGGVPNGSIPSMTSIPGAGEVLDMPVDPNEPTYCICQQVSYGEMIGCDNLDCPIEWFHFGCMTLTTKPKGKWYCPKCQPMFKKKK